MTLLLLGALLMALAVFILFVGLALRVSAPDSLAQVLQQYGAGPRSLEEIEMSRPFAERIIIPILRSLARVVQRMLPQGNVEATSHLLDVAGNPFNMTVIDFLGLRGLSAIVLAVLTFFYVNASRLNPSARILYVGAALLLGFYLPLFWLEFKARARREQVERALPDALDLLTISVEAGLGLDAAMQRVTQKWDNELSRAFARALAEIRVGKLRSEALRDMANRLDVSDVSSFVASVIQAEQLGVGIVNVLHIQSEQMRVVRRQRAQEKAQKAPVKMVFPLALCIFPAMFIVILGPALLRFLASGFLRR